MSPLTLFASGVCLLVASSVFGQDIVSVYRLSHKPPKQARRLFKRGLVELKLRHYQASADLFGRASSADPGFWDAANNLGYASIQLSRPDEAEQAFKRATEIDPANPLGFMNWGIAALCGKDYVLAESLARRALQLNPSMAQGKAVLALAQLGEGKWTPPVRKLLEESRQSVPAADKILRKWPEKETQYPPRLIIVPAGILAAAR